MRVGHTCVGDDHLHRYWPYSESSRPRTHASLLKNAEDAAKNAVTVSIGFVTE